MFLREEGVSDGLGCCQAARGATMSWVDRRASMESAQVAARVTLELPAAELRRWHGSSAG